MGKSSGLRAAVLCAVVCVGCSAPMDGVVVPDAGVGPPGPEGPAGAPGADGQMRIYGDGSAGDRIVSGDEVLGDENLQYGHFTVAAGARLAVPSGVVLRCAGAFTNHGTLVVSGGVLGGYVAIRSGGLAPLLRPAEAGIARSPADSGEAGDNSASRLGGLGGVGLQGALQARSVLLPGLRGGGGGGGGSSFGGVLAPGGTGGGTLVVLAREGVHIDGTVVADGETGAPGAGGGGGGVLVFASPGAVVNRGLLQARGGGGGASSQSGGPGGGGGGGIVHLLSPRITPEGAVSIDGGEAGIQGGAGSTSAPLRQGGGGGGGSGGSGGSGGAVTAGGAGSPLPAQAGGVGAALRTAADPTALF
jgi:hypothetical protein